LYYHLTCYPLVEVIYLLLVCSLSVAALFLVAFVWAARSGQYDDLTTPAWRALFEPTAPLDVRSTADQPNPRNPTTDL
jgi:cbb3-type cytochrome oxidase maturation protein